MKNMFLKHTLFWPLFRNFVCVIFSCCSMATHASDYTVVSDSPAMPEFQLLDHNGQAFNQDSLAKQWTLVLIGFTSCPDVCPYTLGNLAHVIEETSSRVTPANIPKVVFLAVGPDRDKNILEEYVNHYSEDFIGVTGEKHNIDKFVQGLDAFYKFEESVHAHGKKQYDHGVYNVVHSADVRVLDPTGSLVATLNTPMDAYATADILLKLQIEYRKNL